MKGRRFPVETDEAGTHIFPELTQPGDYCGPLTGFTGDRPAMFFRLPIPLEQNVPRHHRAMNHIEFPPHGMVEEADGTVTITGSIGSMKQDGTFLWHGYLEKGSWREV
jgi:hypothetical protein